jgi:hypothetical protein
MPLADTHVNASVLLLHSWHDRSMRFLKHSRVLAALFLLIPAHAAPPATPKTKLVVAIIVDQFRYDYMTRFDSAYHDGLRGAFSNRDRGGACRVPDGVHSGG